MNYDASMYECASHCYIDTLTKDPNHKITAKVYNKYKENKAHSAEILDGVEDCVFVQGTLLISMQDAILKYDIEKLRNIVQKNKSISKKEVPKKKKRKLND